MSSRGEQAVVLGASMAGLLAARVLADFYRSVTVVERDVLPDGPTARRGVPQGRQGHALLGRGGQVIDELFPGLLTEWAAGGGETLDYQDLPRIHCSFGGHLLVRSPATRTEPLIYLSSRPYLEAKVRERLKQLPNVAFLEGHDVVDLTTNSCRSRVSGVTVAGRNSGDENRWLPADLVVDATGRGSRTPTFLKDMGYQPPVEQHVTMHTVYASVMVRIPPDQVEPLVVIGPVPERPTGLFISRYEDNQWIFCVFGMLGHEPPGDLAGMVRFVEGITPEHILSAVRSAEQLGEVARHRLPSNQWRRYDLLHRLPDGLLVCGDAISSFNPIYGQGMTVGALDALAMRDCLRHGTRRLPARYFRKASKAVGLAWRMAAGSDLVFPETEGPRTLATRLTNRYVGWVLEASESDVVVAERFLRVNHFLDHPVTLMEPTMGMRVARAKLRPHRQAATDRRQPVGAR